MTDIVPALAINNATVMSTAFAGRRHAGFSLIELMVAVTLGMLVMGVITMAFISSSSARRATDQASQQVENGRYAMHILSEDLQLAGYYSEFDPRPLATPGAKPNPCATDVASLKAALPLAIQGYDNPAGATLVALANCSVTDVRAGTDIMVIRRTSTCVAGSPGCDAFAAGMAYFQASLCAAAAELDSANPSDYYAMDTTNGVGTTFTKHKKDCATAADLRRFVTRIYFIANNDNAGDGIPTLKRAELIGAGAPCVVPGANCFLVVPLVEGIENMQLEYGLDTSAIPDGAPDVFTADPDGYTGAGAAGVAGNWRNVVAVRVNLLARNTQTSAGYTDSKVYVLGKNADASANTFTPNGAAAAYKRHAFVAEVRMTNPAQRGITP